MTGREDPGHALGGLHSVVHCVWTADVLPGGWAPLRAHHPGHDDAALRADRATAATAGRFPDLALSVVLARGSAEACLRDLGTLHRVLVVGRVHSTVLDVLGLGTFIPKHAKRFTDLQAIVAEAVRAYAEEVRTGVFPGEAQTVRMEEAVLTDVLGGGELDRADGSSIAAIPLDRDL